MPSSRRISRSRRRFLKSIPTAVAAGAAATTLRAEQSGPAVDIITADTLDTAQHLIGVHLPEGEREAARPLVIRNLDNYAAIRRVNVPSTTRM